MSIREEQCNKVCRILDDVLANRTTERDSLIIAVRKAFESLEQLGNSEPLPSAQPDSKELSFTQKKLDTISRQAAVDICANAIDLWHGQIGEGALVAVRDKIAELTPAEPKEGRWIEISSITHTYKCSVCGRLLVNVADGRNNVSKHYPYCHCGADMRGEQDG